jgi:hypothetical protein
MVLEKAWAKIFGGYKTIEAGLQSEVFKAITQAPVSVFDHGSEDEVNLWDMLATATQKKEPVGAATGPNPPFGIIGGHAYGVLGVGQHTSNDNQVFPKAVHMYNPHHADHYKGSIPNEMEDDGSFWCTFAEYKQAFTITAIAHVVSDAVVSYTTINKDKLTLLEFEMIGDEPFAVQLEWPSERLLRGCGHHIRPKFTLAVAKTGSLTETRQIHSKTRPYMNNARADLPGGKGTYVVVVHATFPNIKALENFTLNVYSKEQTRIK